MICFSCHTYFCYLCGSYPPPSPLPQIHVIRDLGGSDTNTRTLNRDNRYEHYRMDGPFKTHCSGRLFEGLEGNRDPPGRNLQPHVDQRNPLLDFPDDDEWEGEDWGDEEEVEVFGVMGRIQ